MAKVMVRLKDLNHNLTIKTEVLHVFSADLDDPVISDCVETARNEFNGDPETTKTTVTITL